MTTDTIMTQRPERSTSRQQTKLPAFTSLIVRDAGPGDAASIAALHSKSWKNAYRGLLSDAYLDGALAEEHSRQWQSLLGQSLLAPSEATALPHFASRPEGFVRLIEREDILLGFISVWINYKAGYDAYVDNLHVRPDLRGGGIGGHLLRNAAAKVIEQGFRSLSLDVLEGNLAAIGFYEKMGGISRERSRDEMGGVMVDYRLMAWDDAAELIQSE
jgi:ribosomal protein S18 acetylase RimI-like enzyme